MIASYTRSGRVRHRRLIWLVVSKNGQSKKILEQLTGKFLRGLQVVLTKISLALHPAIMRNAAIKTKNTADIRFTWKAFIRRRVIKLILRTFYNEEEIQYLTFTVKSDTNITYNAASILENTLTKFPNIEAQRLTRRAYCLSAFFAHEALRRVDKSCRQAWNASCCGPLIRNRILMAKMQYSHLAQGASSTSQMAVGGASRRAVCLVLAASMAYKAKIVKRQMQQQFKKENKQTSDQFFENDKVVQTKKSNHSLRPIHRKTVGLSLLH
uniref:Uncharacterized protein n=1 Tax=Romanomermis culicivorax TaxID=13658 RepID=A0A915IJ07_ROMCU